MPRPRKRRDLYDVVTLTPQIGRALGRLDVFEIQERQGRTGPIGPAIKGRPQKVQLGKLYDWVAQNIAEDLLDVFAPVDLNEAVGLVSIAVVGERLQGVDGDKTEFPLALPVATAFNVGCFPDGARITQVGADTAPTKAGTFAVVNDTIVFAVPPQSWCEVDYYTAANLDLDGRDVLRKLTPEPDGVTTDFFTAFTMSPYEEVEVFFGPELQRYSENPAPGFGEVYIEELNSLIRFAFPPTTQDLRATYTTLYADSEPALKVVAGDGVSTQFELDGPVLFPEGGVAVYRSFASGVGYQRLQGVDVAPASMFQYRVTGANQGIIELGTVLGTDERLAALYLSVVDQIRTGIVTVLGDYDALRTDYIILVDLLGNNNPATVTLPTAELGIVGREYIIKDSSGIVGTGLREIIIVGEGGEDIDGAISKTINVPYGAVTIIAEGTQWLVISE